MNLYELSENYQRLQDYLQSVDATGEEYEQEFYDTLEAISDAIDVKAEGYAQIINQLNADVKTLKDEEKRLAIKRIALENNIRKLKETLTQEMIATDKTKIKTAKFSIWVQNNPVSVDVINELDIPGEYWVPQLPRLDKKSLLDDLKSGKDIPGATTKQTQGVRFR